jgi:MFS family permease
MSWLAVLLVGLGCTDLVHSVRPVRWLPQATGALVAVVTGLGAGLTATTDVVALVVVAGLVLGWGHTVTRGFGRDQPWLPLLFLGVSVLVGVLVGGLAPPADGLVGHWLGSEPLPLLAGLSADRFLLLVGVFLVQLSTGNVVVRLVLSATGTLNPTKDGSLPATPLKGGRLLGPMERVFILALALAGQVTAAAIVVAAKGLLRFPELSSERDQAQVHRMTEYFLVGSFASWLVALGSLVLLVR